MIYKLMVFTTTLLLFFIPVSTHAQGSDEYVVLLCGDTLYGEVEYINERQTEFHTKIRITHTSGKRKKYNRKKVSAFKTNGFKFQSFHLSQPHQRVSFHSLTNPIYNIESRTGEHHFLKLITEGNLSQYQLEWIEQGEAGLNSMTLFKKKDDQFFMRADQGVFGLKRKALIGYFSDCQELKIKIDRKTIRQVSEVVDFYNNHCND